MEQRYVAWALRYNAYERLAAEPDALRSVLQPLVRAYEATGVVPEWAGVDLLRAWAFLLQREHYWSGGYTSVLTDRRWMAVAEAVRRHPRATRSMMPPPAPTPRQIADVCET